MASQKISALKLTSLKKIPETPAVYFFKNSRGQVLYIGKAANLKNRLLSYFKGTLDYKTQSLIQKTQGVFYFKVSSPFSALILEAKLVKQYQPKFNIKLKDDKCYPYIEITKEKTPRIAISRKKRGQNLYLGPFTSRKTIEQVLKFARTIFPFRTCRTLPKKPCIYFDLKLCPAPCHKNLPTDKTSLNNLVDFLTGKDKRLLKNLQGLMRKASKEQRFEDADLYKKQIEKIKQVNKIAITCFDFTAEEAIFDLVKIAYLKRIECFDISVFAKQDAVGSMVVVKNGEPLRSDYRRFKIKGKTQDDVSMMKEILERRLKHQEWPLPQLFIVDGGRGQVKTAQEVIDKFKLKIPVLGLIKKKEELIKIKENGSYLRLRPTETQPFFRILQKIRDESHRFAINYHRLLRNKKILAKKAQ